jgi:hypothetical protein
MCNTYLSRQIPHCQLLIITVKVLDWGEDGIATAAETAALRASFKQEVAVWHKLDHPNVTKVKGTLSINGLMSSAVTFHR